MKADRVEKNQMEVDQFSNEGSQEYINSMDDVMEDFADIKSPTIAPNKVSNIQIKQNEDDDEG